MLIVVNGERQELPESASITHLLAHLGLAGTRVAVEVNGQIAPRAGWSSQALHANDAIEVVRAIGGG